MHFFQRLQASKYLPHPITIRVDQGEIVLASCDAAQFVEIGRTFCTSRDFVLFPVESIYHARPGVAMRCFCIVDGSFLSVLFGGGIDATFDMIIFLPLLPAHATVAVSLTCRIVLFSRIEVFGNARSAGAACAKKRL